MAWDLRAESTSSQPSVWIWTDGDKDGEGVAKIKEIVSSGDPVPCPIVEPVGRSLPSGQRRSALPVRYLLTGAANVSLPIPRCLALLLALGLFGCDGRRPPTPSATETEAPAVPTEPEAPLEPRMGEPVELLRPRRLVITDEATCQLDDTGTLDCFDPWDGCMAAPRTYPPLASVVGGGNFLCGLRRDGLLRCWRGGELEQQAVTHARSVSAGGECAILLDETLACWRTGTRSLDPETPEGRFLDVGVGARHRCAIREDGTMTCWGFGAHGEADAPEGAFTQVVSASQRNCAIRKGGRLVCWGERTEAPPGRFRQVSLAGTSHACALREDGEVLCWGHGLEDFVRLEGGPWVEVEGLCARSATGAMACMDASGQPRRNDGQTRIADAAGACDAPPPPRPPTPTAATEPRRALVDEVMREAVHAHDVEAADGFRNRVIAADLPHLVEEYERLTDWEEKVLLVHVVQDHSPAPQLRSVMHDILRSPDLPGDDVWWVRAVALSYFDGNSANFDRYNEDRGVSRRRTRYWLERLDAAE